LSSTKFYNVANDKFSPLASFSSSFSGETPCSDETNSILSKTYVMFNDADGFGSVSIQPAKKNIPTRRNPYAIYQVTKLVIYAEVVHSSKVNKVPVFSCYFSSLCFHFAVYEFISVSGDSHFSCGPV